MKLLYMIRVSYLHAQIMHLMSWSLVRVQVATLLYMMFDHRLAFYGPLLTLWCNMSSIDFTCMHELGNLDNSDSEMGKLMIWMVKRCMVFAVFSWACSKCAGKWIWQVSWWICEGGHLYAYKWPLCQNWHAIRESCSPCLGECPHVCGINNGCVFDMQNAVLVNLDTLCNIDSMLMKTRGKHEWYT